MTIQNEEPIIEEVKKPKKKQKCPSLNLKNFLSELDIAAMNEDQARAFYEGIRWPTGPVCPYCGHTKSWTMHSRKGYYKCASCRGQYNVKIGTMMHDSHIPIRTWLVAIYELCVNKKGVSALSLLPKLKLSSYESSWFLMHRIRCAMIRDPFASKLDGIIEADEVYMGNRKRKKTKIASEVKIRKVKKSYKIKAVKPAKTTKRRKTNSKRGRGTGKTPVLVLVERGGQSISIPVDRLNKYNLTDKLLDNISKEATIITDGFKGYCECKKVFAEHLTVNHSQGIFSKKGAHVNTVESRNSLMRRGYFGIYHQYSDRHLHRYCTEFDYRWNHQQMKPDEMFMSVLPKLQGRKMMYKRKETLFPVYTFKQVIQKVNIQVYLDLFLNIIIALNFFELIYFFNN